MEDVPRLGRTSPAEEVVPRLPVPCPLALEGGGGVCVWGTMGTRLPPASCPPSCPRRQPPGPCLLHSGSARGDLTMRGH